MVIWDGGVVYTTQSFRFLKLTQWSQLVIGVRVFECTERLSTAVIHFFTKLPPRGLKQTPPGIEGLGRDVKVLQTGRLVETQTTPEQSSLVLY